MSRLPDSESGPYAQAWEDAIGYGFGRGQVRPAPKAFYEMAAQQPAQVPCLLLRREEKPLSVTALTVFGRLLGHRPDLATSCLGDVTGVCEPMKEPASHVIVRLLLAAALTAQAEDRPDAARSAWEEAAHHGAAPFDGDEWPRDRLQDGLNEAAKARRRGKHYRILFPTARRSTHSEEENTPPEEKNAPSKERGQLVWAEITVCASLDKNTDSKSRLVLAPWTFFRPSNEPHARNKTGKVDWKELRDNFPQAIANIDQSAPYDYLLSLQPLAPEDAPSGGLLECLAWSTALAPGALKIGGPSLGVAVALAAHAAANDRRIRPVVATGRIDGQGGVIGVSHVPQKVRSAWEGSWIDREDAPLFLYPRDNTSEVRPAAADLGFNADDQDGKFIWLRSLADLKPNPDAKRDLFTDGFDGYRKWFEKYAPSSPPEGDLAEQCSDASPVLSRLYARLDPAWEPDDDTADWRRLNAADAPTAADDSYLYELTAWFNDDPSELADEVFRRLREPWKERIVSNPTQCYHDAVVLRVCVADLLEGDGWPADDSVLPGRLARAVETRCRASWPKDAGPLPSPLPSAEDFAAALRRKGKLILVIHDRKSLALWEKIDDNRFRLMQCLRRLAESQGQDVKPQHVILVFSDLHHQMWFGERGRRP